MLCGMWQTKIVYSSYDFSSSNKAPLKKCDFGWGGEFGYAAGNRFP